MARTKLIELSLRAALPLIGLAGGLLLTEIGLRLELFGGGQRDREKTEELPESQQVNQNEFGFYEYDETLGWRGKPLATGTFRGTEFSNSIRLNSLGFRDSEIPFEKRDDVFRILALGDSMAWGYGVEQDERFSEFLEALIRKTGLEPEVVNLGMTGYGTDQEFLLFQRLGVRYQADLVLVAFYWNDLLNNSTRVAYSYPKPQFVLEPSGSLGLQNVPVPRKARWEEATDGSETSAQGGSGAWAGIKSWLSRHSRAYVLFAGWVRQSAGVQSVFGKLGMSSDCRRGVPESRWKLTRRILETFEEAARAGGSEFLVVLIPRRSELEVRDPLFDCYRSHMEGLPILDLLGAFKAGGTPDALYFRYNGSHLRAAGHQLMAQAIFDHLKDSASLLNRRAP